MNKKHSIESIDVVLKHETDSAYLVESVDTGKDAWVPKSRCEYNAGELQIEHNLALEKGLI